MMQTTSDNTPLESAIYTGSVYHQRYLPKIHKFNYKIYLFWLNLDELSKIETKVKGFSCTATGFSAVRFKRDDDLGDSNITMQKAVVDKMNELSSEKLDGVVKLLGQVRTLGRYCSLVN